MSRGIAIDCVVVGHNDPDFDRRAGTARRLRNASGLYDDLQMNSVLLEGRRMTYMDLIDRARAAVSGRHLGLNVFRSPSLAVAHLTNALRRRNLRAEYVNSFNYDQDYLLALLREAPSTVAITTTYYVENEPLQEIVAFVRKHTPKTKIIVGGPHIYNLCEDLDPCSLEYALTQIIGADVYIHDAQGETTLCAVVEAIRSGRFDDVHRVPNLLVHPSGDRRGLMRTGRKLEVNNLEDNRIDWRLFPVQLLFAYGVAPHGAQLSVRLLVLQLPDHGWKPRAGRTRRAGGRAAISARERSTLS